MSLPAIVGVDGRNLVLPHGTGVATYAATLCRCLPLIGREAEILVAEPLWPHPVRWLAAALPGAARANSALPGPDGMRRRAAPDLFRIAQVYFDLWRRPLPVSGRDLPDLMHWTYLLPMRMAGRPNVYAIHDLIPLLQPTLTDIDGPRARRMLAAVTPHAAHFVTVSEATRQELIVALRLPPGRVTNTWQAVDVAAVDPAPATGLMAGRYWLHVGAVERRKNIRALIAAWRASGTRLPLVLAGPDRWNAAEQLADAGKVVPDGTRSTEFAIVRIPWLARPQLLALVRDAMALLMPSLAEGFGLPVAEAMTLGTPVLTSDRGALAEVAGAAGLLVDPTDGGALTAGLRALEADAELRARLVAEGRLRARLFTLEAYAGRLRGVYDRLLP